MHLGESQGCEYVIGIMGINVNVEAVLLLFSKFTNRHRIMTSGVAALQRRSGYIPVG